MNTLALLSTFGDRVTSTESRRLHCAFFLAQSSTQAPCYSFSLMRGRVFSQELDQDLVFFQISRLTHSAEALSSWAKETEATYAMMSKLLHWLLEHDTAVVEAAATKRFYSVEGLGDPSTKLRWYDALPSDIKSAASELEASAHP